MDQDLISLWITLKLATITCDRIKGNDQWDVSKCARKRAHPGVVRKLAVAYSPEEGPVTPPLAAQANVANKTDKPPSPDILCWNCLEKGHGVGDCPKPIVQARVEKNKEAFYRKKRSKPFNLKPRPTNRPKKSPRPGAFVQHPVATTQPKKKRTPPKPRMEDRVNALISRLHAAEIHEPQHHGTGHQGSIEAPVHVMQDLLRSLL